MVPHLYWRSACYTLIGSTLCPVDRLTCADVARLDSKKGTDLPSPEKREKAVFVCWL
jgi:hypothetical protein